MNHSRWNILFVVFVAVLILLQVGPDAYSQEKDSTQYQLRQFDREDLAELQNKSQYDYSIQRGEGTTIWARIKSWFNDLLRLLLSGSGSGFVIRMIFYILLIGVIIYSILRFLGADPSALIQPSKKQGIRFNVAEENIHDIDFNKEIETALTNHDYRLATRLYYLQALKLLSDNELIQWEAGKTNAEYFYELQNSTLRSNFSALGHMFEYVWYGGFSIAQPAMDRVKELYNTIDKEARNILS